MNKINNINKESPGGLFTNLRKVISGTGLSRIFGLIRDISTTNLLGASIFHDIFVICLKIPNLFRRFFAEGAFNQAFIPIYSDYEKENNSDSTFEFLNSLAGILITTLFIFTLIVLIFALIFIFRNSLWPSKVVIKLPESEFRCTLGRNTFSLSFSFALYR